MTIVVFGGRCQFCHRTSSEVTQIVAGDSAFICDECVKACSQALTPKSAGSVAAESADRYAFQRLVRHFAPHSAHEMHATSRSFPIRQQADLQQALDALLGERQVPDTFIGIQAHSRHEAVGFSTLLERGGRRVEIAPPQYEEIDIGQGESVRCLKNGLWLLRDRAAPYAVILSQLDDYGRGQSISLEVAVPAGGAGAEICSRVFDAIERNYGVSRGVLTAFWAFETDYGGFQGNFNTLNSLMTLSHDCRRPGLFQPQVLSALELYEKAVA